MRLTQSGLAHIPGLWCVTTTASPSLTHPHPTVSMAFDGLRSTAGLDGLKRLDCQADTAWTNHEWTMTAKMPLPAITSPGGPEVSVPLADRLHAGAASWRKPSAGQEALQSIIMSEIGAMGKLDRFVMVAMLPEAAYHRKRRVAITNAP